MRLLRITLNGREHPHYTITNAFKSKFTHVDTIWWQQLPLPFLQATIMQHLKNGRYDAVFMQIQRAGVLSAVNVQEMSRYAPVFNWTGDVRKDLSFYKEIGQHCITLFSNQTDVDTLRAAGYRAEYLQCGYDDKHFYNKRKPRQNYIIFCANNYPQAFPLSKERDNVVNELRKAFGGQFRLYGANWNPPSLGVIADDMEAELYNQCAIAISFSHFAYKRYYSRRLLVEMACGAFVLSHEYPEYEKDFTNGEHLVTFKNTKELIEKCHYYLKNQDEARRIGEKGCELVTSTCKWTNRVDEFIEIMKKYKK